MNKRCELLYLVACVENSILWVDCFLWFIEMAEKEKQLVSEVSSSEEKKLDFAGIALTTSTPKTTKEGDRVKQKLPHTIADDLQSVKPKVSAPDQDAVLHLGQKHKNPFSKLACNFGDTSSSGTNKLQNTFYDKDGNSINQVYEFNANIPRIPQFSGDDPPQKGDVSYKEWRFEVQCLIGDPDVKPNLLIQSIRRSLRGTAKTMLIPLGEKASVKQILEKLDILFGEISNNGMIM